MTSQTALQAWQVALFAQIDAASKSLSTDEQQVLFDVVAKRAQRRQNEARFGIRFRDAQPADLTRRRVRD